LAGAVPAVLDVLRGGGELYTVELAARGASLPLAEVLAPADGASGVVALAAKAARPLRLSVTTRGQERSVSTRPVAVAASWLAPHLDPAAAARPREMRLLAGASTTALIEPVVHPAEPPPAPGVHGFMERSVVRNALSLAFTPRARACYLNRPSSTPAERDLAGRVRLALDLVRGEVGAVRVEGSTLARPAIETCLREAAFGLEVPRAYRNDDPVTAVLNLVFRPRNPQEKRGAISDPGVAEQMDLLIEEALEAMREEGAPAPAAAGPPPGAPPETTDRAPPPLGR
jgi:hypothetical protein